VAVEWIQIARPKLNSDATPGRLRRKTVHTQLAAQSIAPRAIFAQLTEQTSLEENILLLEQLIL